MAARCCARISDIRLVNPDNPIGLDRRDPAGRDDITTINRMNLPVGKPVIVFLSSKDVVHSFGLPQMRVKQDATPGIVQPVWFTPTQTGEWDIACSQLCGLGHFSDERRLRHPESDRLRRVAGEGGCAVELRTKNGSSFPTW